MVGIFLSIESVRRIRVEFVTPLHTCSGLTLQLKLELRMQTWTLIHKHCYVLTNDVPRAAFRETRQVRIRMTEVRSTRYCRPDQSVETRRNLKITFKVRPCSHMYPCLLAAATKELHIAVEC